MKIYWSYKSIPELIHLSPRERKAIVKKVKWKPLRHWQVWATTIILCVAILFSFHFGRWLVRQYLQEVAAAAGAGVHLAVMAAAFFIQFQVRCRYLRPYLRKELGEKTCIECGYLLIGQTSPRCPECGTAFDEELLERFAELRNLEDRGQQTADRNS